MKRIILSIPHEAWLFIIWVGLIILINPAGEFPINDDFAYSKNVWYLSEEGRFLFSDWPGMTLIVHTLTGAAVTSLFGFSFLTLRLTTLFFGIGLLILLFRFLKQLGAGKNLAFYTSLLIMFSPIFLSLSFTFMTEVYFLFFMLLGIYCYDRFLRLDRPVFLILYAVSALLATLIRQTGLLLVLAVFLAELIRMLADVRSYSPARRIRNIMLALMALLINYAGIKVFENWALGTDNLSTNYARAGDLFEIFSHQKADYFMRHAGTILMYTGLFLLPLTLRRIYSLRLASSFTGRLIQALLMTFFLVLIIMGIPEFPRPNVFYNLGLGPKLLRDSYWGDNISPQLPKAAWSVIVYLAAGSGMLLAAHICQPFRWTWRIIRRHLDRSNTIYLMLILTIGGISCYLLLNKFQFDRYILPLTVLLGIVLNPISAEEGIPDSAGRSGKSKQPAMPTAGIKGSSRPGRIPGLSATVLLGIMALFSVSAVRDYMEWQRTRWEALDFLTVEKGIDPRRIDGGFEFNAWLETGPFNPSHKDEKSWWFVTEDEYLLASGPVKGFEPYASFNYRRWLWPGKDSLQILWHSVPEKLPYSAFPLECDCETLDTNPHYMLSKDKQVRFEGGGLRSDMHARSGTFSVRLDRDQPYGMLHRFIDVEPGEAFLVRIWKYGTEEQVQIVSGGGSGCHTVMSTAVIERDNSGWELMEMRTTVPEGFACHHYGIYLWNSGGGEVWLDDLEILRLPAADDVNEF